MEKGAGNVYDTVIVGAGPAGLTAALYAIRGGLKTLLISKDLGGTANSIISLGNWPGYNGSGIELMKRFYEQLNGTGIEVVLGDIQKVEKKGKEFIVKTADREFETRTVILSTGIKRRNFKLPGEERLKGKGISYCVTCDAFFFKDKITAIIVEKDCDREAIFTLANLAKKVYVLCREKKLKCEGDLKELVKNGKVEIICDVTPLEFRGNGNVDGLVIKEDNKENREIKVDGIFIEMGSTPMIEFTKGLWIKMDKENYIVVDEEMRTSIKGIFAAGDVTNSKLKQVLTASAQGAIAAKRVGDFLQR
jgi:thioredoxin-disulfide reductase